MPLATVRAILEGAARAPSGGNLQPWRVHALAGERLEALKANIRGRPDELPRGEGAEYDIYPPDLKEPFRTRRFQVGELLYRSLGVPREDRPGRIRQYARNFEFFGAPHVAFVFMPSWCGLREAADVGMFAQSLMLGLAAHGIASCPQTALSFAADTVREELEVAPDLKLLFGISFGYEQAEDLANNCRMTRAELAQSVQFVD